LGQQRNSFFVVIETALLASLGAVAAAALKGDQPGPSLLVMGLVAVVFSIFARQLLSNWREVNVAGRAYRTLRLATARMVEKRIRLSALSLAKVELDLSMRMVAGRAEANKKTQMPPFRPYPHTVPELSINPLPAIGGWASTEGLIRTLEVLWLLIGVGSVLLAGTGFAVAVK